MKIFETIREELEAKSLMEDLLVITNKMQHTKMRIIRSMVFPIFTTDSSKVIEAANKIIEEIINRNNSIEINQSIEIIAKELADLTNREFYFEIVRVARTICYFVESLNLYYLFDYQNINFQNKAFGYLREEIYRADLYCYSKLDILDEIPNLKFARLENSILVDVNDENKINELVDKGYTEYLNSKQVIKYKIAEPFYLMGFAKGDIKNGVSILKKRGYAYCNLLNEEIGIGIIKYINQAKLYFKDYDSAFKYYVDAQIMGLIKDRVCYDSISGEVYRIISAYEDLDDYTSLDQYYYKINTKYGDAFIKESDVLNFYKLSKVNPNEKLFELIELIKN